MMISLGRESYIAGFSLSVLWIHLGISFCLTQFLQRNQLIDLWGFPYNWLFVLLLLHLKSSLFLSFAILIMPFKFWSEIAQSCLTLCDPMDCSLPGSSIHGILQARILEWVAIAFSRRSSQPRDQTRVSCIAGRRFNLWATRKAHLS